MFEREHSQPRKQAAFDQMNELLELKRFIEHFSNAGLDLPTIFSETPTGGGSASLLYAWATLTLRSVLPRLESASSIDPVKIDLNTQEDRMREAVASARSQITFAQQYCG